MAARSPLSRKTASRREERSGASLREEAWYVIHAASRAERILPDGKEQLAELLEIPLDDLTELPFGIKSTMWMSRSKQLDDTVIVNRPASHALRLGGALTLTIRGDVIVHHEAADMNAEKEKILKAAREVARQKRSPSAA